MIITIAARELRSLFLSPLAWAILAVIEFILAYLFLGQLDFYVQVQPQLALNESAPGLTEVIVSPLFSNASIVLMLVVPLVTMRLVADERRGGTLPLLYSAPLSLSEIVLGKYLGLIAFLAILLATIALMPLSLLFVADLDFGLFAADLIGLALMLAAFAAAGLFMSSLTAHPAVAAITTFGLLLLLWIIDWAGEDAHPIFAYLSLRRHYESLLRGLFDSADVIYYLLFIITFLVLTVIRLDAERLQK